MPLVSVYFSKVRVDNVINVERFLDKVNLIHMLRIAYAGDDLRATYFFGKGRDDHVLFVAVRAGNQKIEGANGTSSEQADLFGVADDRHDIVLLGNAIDDRFVLIYDGNGMIASGQRIGHFETKLAGTDNGYSHDAKITNKNEKNADSTEMSRPRPLCNPRFNHSRSLSVVRVSAFIVWLMPPLFSAAVLLIKVEDSRVAHLLDAVNDA